LVEIAQNYIPRAIWNCLNPVIESLPVMFGKIRARLLHFNDATGLPNQIREGGSFAIVLLESHFKDRTGLWNAPMAESPEKSIQEDLGLALLIAFQMREPKLDEFV
jgi:hypothetical protein